LVLGVLGLVWLPFLPNAPNIVTDFVHVRQDAGAVAWLDAAAVGALLAVLYAGAYRALEGFRPDRRRARGHPPRHRR
jgi:uncharacterized membrane protein